MFYAAAEANDATEVEGRCWEESRSKGGDNHWSGIDQHTEEVLSSNIGAQLLIPGKGHHNGKYSKFNEHNDGTAQVLQPPISH